MNIELRLKDDDFLMVIGNLDHSDEPVTYDLYGYDEQENQLLFRLTRKQTIELLSDLMTRSEFKNDIKKIKKRWKILD